MKDHDISIVPSETIEDDPENPILTTTQLKQLKRADQILSFSDLITSKDRELAEQIRSKYRNQSSAEIPQPTQDKSPNKPQQKC